MNTLQSQKSLLRQLIFRRRNRGRLVMAWISLCAGTTLLLISLLIWWNFRELLYGNHNDDSLGKTFLTISKKITSENMGKPETTIFGDGEIDQLLSAPQVSDAGVLTSNRFPAYITLNSRLAFSSDVFLEAVPDRFIDERPEDWHWEEGSQQVPIIMSREFLNLYNYGFAISQGLPQLSEKSIQALAFDLNIGLPEVRQTYSAHVVGFSDRITSVLVPQSFMSYANQKFSIGGSHVRPSRVILSVKDPSSTEFVQFLEKRGYVANAEKLRWSKMRAVVDVVVLATGVLAIMLMAISILVFVMFIELTIAQASSSLTLLLQIGYEGRALRRFVRTHFLPLVFTSVALSVLITVVLQIALSTWAPKMSLKLPLLPGWPVWLGALVTAFIFSGQVSRSVKQAIKRV